MAVLYRKYRPQNFAQMVGQKHIVQTLQNAVEMGKPAHAYLYTGTRGVGKTSVARIMAKAVNCLKPVKGGDACGKCEVCKAIEANNFLDLIEVDAASNTGVENVRELIEHARFSPSLGKYKVFIIDEVHMLSKGAFNALLKTLEEPPAHAIFILATTEIQKVPATIISRTQRFDFGQIEKSDIIEALASVAKQEGVKLSKESAAMIGARAEGSLRDALSLLDKIFTLGDEPQTEEVSRLLGVSDVEDSAELLNLIIAKDAEKIISHVEGLQRKGIDFQIFNKDFLEYLRKILIFNLSAQTEGFDLSKEHLENLKSQAVSLPPGEGMRVIRLFLRSYNELSTAPNPSLPILLASLEVFVRPTGQQSAAVVAKPVATTKEYHPQPRTQGPSVETKSVSKEIEPESLPDTPTYQTESQGNIDISKINDHWPEVLAEIKKTNSPLAMMVKNSTIYGTDGDKLIFEVRFAFDKESLEQAKNSQIIRAAIEKACQQKVRIYAKIVKKNIAVEPQESAASLADALTVFEGELVE